LQHHKQGQEKSKEEWEVLWKFQEIQVSPLEFSPFVLDAALLAPPQLSFST